MFYAFKWAVMLRRPAHTAVAYSCGTRAPSLALCAGSVYSLNLRVYEAGEYLGSGLFLEE
jgi:hypothetical protein